ncbi:MAG: hypothetical protein ACR2KC_05320 [Acidimicrobiales bacterium]
MEVCLGLLWLLDGLLQLQPHMFGAYFFTDTLGMAIMGLPGPLSSADSHLVAVLAAHPAAWNLLFATIQLALGAGLLWRRSAAVALGASIPWALAVWGIGEGLGGLRMEGTSLLTGAPGPALLYGAVAVLIWPRRESCEPRLGPTAARTCWAAVWAGGALMELQGVNHSPGVPAAQIAASSSGQPHLVAAVGSAMSRLFAGQGAAFAVCLGAVGLFAGLGALWGGTRGAACIAGAGAAIFVGVIGQDLGGVFGGQATDPGSGPLLLLLAAIVWRQRTASSGPSPSPLPSRSRRSAGQRTMADAIVAPLLSSSVAPLTGDGT